MSGSSISEPNWNQIKQIAGAHAVSVARQTSTEVVTTIAMEITQRVAGVAGAAAGVDAARPFAESAAASEIIALAAADMAREERIAAQAAAASLTEPSLAPELVKNAAGADVGTPFLFDDVSPPADPTTDRRAATRRSVTEIPFDLTASLAVKSPALLRSTMRAVVGDTADCNAHLGFAGFDKTGDATLNNAAWARLAQDAAWYTAATGGLRTFKMDRRQAWRMSQLGFVIPACRLMLGDTVLQWEGAASRSYMFRLAGGTTIDALRINARAGAAWYRTLCLGAPADTLPTHIGRVEVSSDVQMVNRPGNGNRFDAALTIGAGNMRIGSIVMRKQDQAVLINAQAAVTADIVIDDVQIESFRNGLNIDNCNDVTIKNYRYNGSSPNGTADPGQNAILIQSVQRGNFPWIEGRGAAEHAIRVGGLQAGTQQSADLRFGTVICNQPGQTAFKVWNSDLANPVRGLHVDKIVGIDCGYYLTGQGGGNQPRYNDYVANLENCEDVVIGQIFGSGRLTPYCSYDGIQIAGVRNMTLGSVTISGAARHSVLITPYINQSAPGVGSDPAPNREITIGKLVSLNPVDSAVVLVEVPGYALENVEINLRATDGINYVKYTGAGTGATGRILIEYSGTGRSGTADYVGPSNPAIKVRDRAA